MTPSMFTVTSSALLVTLGDRIDGDLTRRIAWLMDDLDRVALPGIVDVIPSYTTILFIYDPVVTHAQAIEGWVSASWEQSERRDSAEDSRTVVIPVVYGDDFGEDIAHVAEQHGWRPEEVIARHVAGKYTVGALGFAPGFAYLLGLDPALATPRRSKPRLRVPPGSVGIGGDQTGVYSLPSPGGWNLIGRTDLPLFQPDAPNPFPLTLGDDVRFEQVDVADFRGPVGGPEDSDRVMDGVVEVLAPGMQTTVQDPGRFGAGRYGFAPNGAADQASFMAANRVVGNPDDAAGLEITLTGPTLRFGRRTAVAVTGADAGAVINGLPLLPGRVQGIMPGDELMFRGISGHGARAYLAIAGGIDVPEVMGSRSTDLTAGIGGHRGRALQQGDRLPLGQWRRSTPASSIAPTLMDSSIPIEVVPGPQRDRFPDAAWDALLGEPFTVSSESNRVGLRLEGPTLHPINGADIISEGIVTGSIQVTGEGQPIVMLPGHATIGGYTKIATVVDGDLDRLGQLKPGDVIRFTSRYRTS